METHVRAGMWVSVAQISGGLESLGVDGFGYGA